MRLWSIHPKYLDAKGLTALWKEALLAKRVLQGKTKSYKNHPQMKRFKEIEDPIHHINTYLFYIWDEAADRGYRFNKRKIGRTFTRKRIKVNDKQVKYEFEHLKNKLKKRHNQKYKQLLKIKKIEPHPLFIVKKGGIEEWEKKK